MRGILMLAALGLLSSCSGDGQKAPSALPIAKTVNAGGCPALPALAGNTPARTSPADISAGPPALRRLAASTGEQLAVANMAGGVHCIDIRRMTAIGPLELHRQDRFLSFRWEGFQRDGYRSDGAILVDRMADGNHIDTGATPVFSPSGAFLAAVHQSATAFSALQGFGVWQVGPFATVQVAKVEDLPEMRDWRIDRWESESCISLSAAPFARTDGTAGGPPPRGRFIAKRGPAGWTVASAESGAC